MNSSNISRLKTRRGGVGLLAQVMKDGAERDREEREIVSVQKCQSSGSSRDRSNRAKMVEPVYPKRGKILMMLIFVGFYG